MPIVGEGEVLTLRAPAEGEVLHCPLGDADPTSYILERGPDVQLVSPSVDRRWIGTGGVYQDGERLSGMTLNATGALSLYFVVDGDVPLNVVLTGSGGAWQVLAPSTLANGTNVIELTPPESGTASFEFDHLDGRVFLRLSSLEA
jgi:hypothetical protein